MPPIKPDPNPRMPYQHPMPKEALPDIVIADAIPNDERIVGAPGRECLVPAPLPEPLAGLLDEPAQGAQSRACSAATATLRRCTAWC